jgi:hypothetical protein
MAIQIDCKINGEKIKDAFENETFQSVMKSCMWSNFMLDWRLFTYFKKDFWREFV